ncbi:MAG: DUF3717 domain-containing protein [Betaproteobacteria bacterium]|jgi:predicted Fe-S protein YdhL (DUF1289 family)
MSSIHITDIEAAINYWRAKEPSKDGITLSPSLRSLAHVYALMVHFHEEDVSIDGFPTQAMNAWMQWYESVADTPCIAICSTSQGDEICKGCGRTFQEVQDWTKMSPTQKRHTWRRITMEHSAWRFNRYSERASLKEIQTDASNLKILPT